MINIFHYIPPHLICDRAVLFHNGKNRLLQAGNLSSLKGFGFIACFFCLFCFIWPFLGLRSVIAFRSCKVSEFSPALQIFPVSPFSPALQIFPVSPFSPAPPVFSPL